MPTTQNDGPGEYAGTAIERNPLHELTTRHHIERSQLVTILPPHPDVDRLRAAIMAAEPEVIATPWHACACWDSGEPGDLTSCSMPVHAVARAKAAAARAEAWQAVVDLAFSVLPTVRPADVAALSRALLAPIHGHRHD